jgi:hypothetical protein
LEIEVTSQVAVANFHGIAVASDTVVTQSSSEGMKTLESMSKIYSLGGSHKVVLVHSGNADINGVAHWLHLTEWIRTLTEPFSTLGEYVNSYLAWANNSKPLHTPLSEVNLMNELLNDHYYYIKNRADSQLESDVEELAEGEKLDENRIHEVFHQMVVEGKKYLDELIDFEGYTYEDSQKDLNAAEFKIDEKIEFIFKDFVITEELRQILVESAGLVLCKYQEMNFVDSQIGFVGFGADEPFGGIVNLHCRGYYGLRIHVYVEPRFGVAPSGTEDGSSSIIRHFAQGDAIYAFIRGYNPRILNRTLRIVRDKIEEVFGEREWEITNDDGEIVGKKTTSDLSFEIADETFKEITENFSQSSFASPLLSSIEGMSIVNLANFAESLVGIQALSTYSQLGTATVGGLIEVVTIDRAEGVIWHQKIGQPTLKESKSTTRN